MIQKTTEIYPLDNKSRDLIISRRLLALTGAVYLVWWFAVQAMLPDAYNPLAGRLVVVMCCFLSLIASYMFSWVRRYLRCFVYVCSWLLTLHYYFLLHMNAGDFNWTAGAFITVIAVSLLMLSNLSLFCYAVFVLVLSVGVAQLNPSISNSVFLPGMVTVFIQAHIALYSRLSLIKNLTESNGRFQTLFNSTFEGIVVYDGEKILNVNDAMMRILGYSRSNIIGRNVYDFIKKEDHQLVSEALKLTEMIPLEIRGLSESQQVIDLEIRVKEIFYITKTAYLITLQDIGDRKKAQQERIMALTLAENVRVRDDFISIASHELKTPLSVLQLQVQMMEQDFKDMAITPEATSATQDAMSLFKRQIGRLNELIETMLDVSRIATGRFVLNKKMFNLSDVVHNIARAMPESLKSKAVQSEVILNVDPQVVLTADQSRLEQVIENILTNAQKYGDGKLIQVKLYQENNWVIFSVEDHGIGIAPEYLDRIFERFERAISARHITGFGLGLYIAKQIVDAHGGQISVQSQVGQGSTFTVKLPVNL